MLTFEQEQKLAWAKEQFDVGEFNFLTTEDIGAVLRKNGLDRKTREAFAKWYVERGIAENWIATKIRFV